MAFDASILADGFLDLQSNPPADETAAIDRMAAILVDYFKTAEAGAVPIIGSAVDAQLATIKTNLAGMKATGPTAIQNACVQFWTTVCAAAATYFTGCAPPSVVSTSLSTIAALMLAAAANTISTEAAPVDATQDLGDAIDTGHTTVPSTVTLTSGPTVVSIL